MKGRQALLLTVTVLISNIALAQTPTIDSNYRPPIGAGKIGQFKSFKKSPSDFIFLGNSIMTYTDWNELLGITNAKNRGIPGDMTFGVLDRLQDVIDGKPAKIFILIGINDINRRIPDSLIIRNYGRMISRIKKGSPKTKIYFHTLLPVNEAFASLKGKRENLLHVNAELRKLAAVEKITLIDLHPHFIDSTGGMDSTLVFDGLHLNELGYFRWAEILKKGGYLKEK